MNSYTGALVPTDDGWVNIALTFVSSLKSDVKANRRSAFAPQMYALCDIVRYLAMQVAKDPTNVEKRDRLESLMKSLREGTR
jgi:hypothetical protein